jgi:hypothetical protein
MAQKRVQAANLLGQGRTRNSVAAELQIDPATISRWRRESEFQAMEARARETALDANPTVRATLHAALSAVHPKTGAPDWTSRIAAARILMGSPEEAPETEDEAPTIHPDLVALLAGSENGASA